MNDRIVVKRSLDRSVFYCLTATCMSLLSLFFLFLDFRNSQGIILFLSSNIVTYVLLKIIFLIGVILFGDAGIFIYKQFKARTELLIVDEKGITDNSSALAFGFIPWEDINQVYIVNGLWDCHIELELANEIEYIKRLPMWKQMIVCTNKKMGHQIVYISLNLASVPLKFIFKQIQTLFEKYKFV